jgi:hypothetical protein
MRQRTDESGPSVAKGCVLEVQEAKHGDGGEGFPVVGASHEESRCRTDPFCFCFCFCSLLLLLLLEAQSLAKLQKWPTLLITP